MAEKITNSNTYADAIKWKKKDEEIRRAYNERVESSRKPSMWQYDPKGGGPTELANLDPSTFLTSRVGETLCFLPKNILIRICSMLSRWRFIRLSLTCRFLHWRMFTFCTCYVPYSVKMRINDGRVYGDSNYSRGNHIPPTLEYTLNYGVINDESTCPVEAALIRDRSYEQGQRGVFLYKPFCLRKPFFFDTLILDLDVPIFCKAFYDKYLPFIVAVRGLAPHLDVIFPHRTHFNYSDTNDFLMMNRVFVIDFHEKARLNVPVFQNCIGIYQNPLDSAVKATLKNFLTGSSNLVFHRYLDVEEINGRIPLIEYLFQEFGEFGEFFFEREDDACFDCDEPSMNHYHVWEKVVATENGGQIRIEIKKLRHLYPYPWHRSKTWVTIGKEETFDEIDEKYLIEPDSVEWRRLETAMEPDEAEELDVALEPDIAEELVTAEEPNKTEEPVIAEYPEVALESVVPEELDETEESDEDEEEQGASGVYLCLGNTPCSIQ